MSRTKSVKIEALARVEGEGGLVVRIRNEKVTDVQLRIFEPPRFFEALLRGRSFREAPDITARICGICPVAYQLTAVQALEAALGAEVEGQLRALRRLLYCGEWIESHALHIHLLHAPDFLGYPSGIHLAQDHPDIVQRGLMLKKTGNDIMALLGGREIHPINVKVGGFYRLPERSELHGLIPPLERALEAAAATVRWTAGLTFPEFDVPHEMVALHHPGEYAIDRGRVVSTRGLELAPREYETEFVEEHAVHSNALNSRRTGGGQYLVGPLARYSLNFAQLSPRARQLAVEAGLEAVCRNPFQSIVVRSIETVYACEEALRIVRDYQRPPRPDVDIRPRASVGHACTEAPRGLLYHRYEMDDDGALLDAKIVPPTSQNQLAIEADLGAFVEAYMDLPPAELSVKCEHVVRNYDPCISCATHFLKLEVDRGNS